MDDFVYDFVFVVSAGCSFTLCTCVCMFIIGKRRHRTKQQETNSAENNTEAQRSNSIGDAGSGCYRPNLTFTSSLTPTAPPLQQPGSHSNGGGHVNSSSTHLSSNHNNSANDVGPSNSRDANTGGNHSNSRNDSGRQKGPPRRGRHKRQPSNAHQLAPYTYVDGHGRAPVESDEQTNSPGVSPLALSNFRGGSPQTVPNILGVSPQTVPNYINNTSYSGPRPELSTLREDSREEEQEAEAEVTVSRDNNSRSHDHRSRSHDSRQVNTAAAPSRGALDLNLDSNFEVILLSPSTPPPPYVYGNTGISPIAFV